MTAVFQILRPLRGFVVALVVLCAAAPADAKTLRSVNFPLRGKLLTLQVYNPGGNPLGTVIMGSGDVGWVGVAASISDFLSDHGYVVIGLNVRQYLSTFTDGRKHLTAEDVPGDFRAMADLLRGEHLLFSPVILSGMSEGAELAVLGASDARNHGWIDGVITMGIPRSAELAWRWTDFTAWVTKRDLSEPSFAPYSFMGGIAPVPLVMIQSRKDEFVSEADYQQYHANAREPKKLVLIDASNHRFTDRQAELHQEYLAAVKWIVGARTF